MVSLRIIYYLYIYIFFFKFKYVYDSFLVQSDNILFYNIRVLHQKIMIFTAYSSSMDTQSKADFHHFEGKFGLFAYLFFIFSRIFTYYLSVRMFFCFSMFWIYQ